MRFFSFNPRRCIPSNFRNSTPARRFPILVPELITGNPPMRRTILTSILVLWSTMVLAQSASPDALYERGMDAITRIGTSRNDMLGIDYFRRSADLGYGPAQTPLASYYEPEP